MASDGNATSDDNVRFTDLFRDVIEGEDLVDIANEVGISLNPRSADAQELNALMGGESSTQGFDAAPSSVGGMGAAGSDLSPPRVHMPACSSAGPPVPASIADTLAAAGGAVRRFRSTHRPIICPNAAARASKLLRTPFIAHAFAQRGSTQLPSRATQATQSSALGGLRARRARSPTKPLLSLARSPGRCLTRTPTLPLFLAPSQRMAPRARRSACNEPTVANRVPMGFGTFP